MISKDVEQSFEAKIHDILIRTNPEKYLLDQRCPKESLILADSYIIKEYYGGPPPPPDKMKLENNSDIFQTIIKSYEGKRNLRQPKNSVNKQYQEHGIQCPNPGINHAVVQSPSGQMISYPGFGWNAHYGTSFPGLSMAVQQPFFSHLSSAEASPSSPHLTTNRCPHYPKKKMICRTR